MDRMLSLILGIAVLVIILGLALYFCPIVAYVGV
jgi:hypothetical protein